MSLLTRLLAFIGFLTVSSLITGALVGLWMNSRDTPSLPDKMVLSFDFQQPVVERDRFSPLSFSLGKESVSLQGIVSALDRARRDDRVKGLFAKVSDVSMDTAQVEEVRAALARFRAAGKFAYAYADSFGETGGSSRPYWLASAFDSIWLQPLGIVGLAGPALSLPFARAALDKVGVIADMHQRYEYKGVADTFTASDLSLALREDYEKMLTSVKRQLVDDIATGRKLKPEAVSALMDRSPLLTQDALSSKLIDRVGYADEFLKAVEEKAGADAKTVDLMDYRAGASPLPTPPAAKEAPLTALIYVDGPIVRLEGESGPFGENATADAETLVKAIRTVTEDADIKALVLRINSPGGSVAASESVHRALTQARAKGKYIVVSMGGMAASGGYWIATAADRIVADSTTLTGSIGVVSGKFVFGPLSEKLGIHWAELSTSQGGGLWSPARPFTPTELTRINAILDDIYASFLTRVQEGRKLPPEKLDKLARGRVWTGADAKAAGLVDEIGGLRTGFDLVRTHYGLKPDDTLRVAILPRPETRRDLILKLLRAYIALPVRLDAVFSPAHLLTSLQASLGLSPATSLRATGTLTAPPLVME